jgi:hypothetical protein
VRGKWYRIPEPNSNPFLPSERPIDDEQTYPKVFPAPSEWGNSTYRDTIMGHSGKFSLDLSETRKNSTVQFVEAVLSVTKATGDNMYDTKLQGVHFPRTGEVILSSTTPKKYLSTLNLLISDSRVFHSYLSSLPTTRHLLPQKISSQPILRNPWRSTPHIVLPTTMTMHPPSVLCNAI